MSPTVLYHVLDYATTCLILGLFLVLVGVLALFLPYRRGGS